MIDCGVVFDLFWIFCWFSVDDGRFIGEMFGRLNICMRDLGFLAVFEVLWEGLEGIRKFIRNWCGFWYLLLLFVVGDG